MALIIGEVKGAAKIDGGGVVLQYRLGSKSVIVTGDKSCPRPVAANKSYLRRVNKETSK